MGTGLHGQVALVTGASGGIGKAICRGLAHQGADVGVHYRTGETAARALVAELAGGGARAQAFAADLTDPAQAAALVATVARAFGRLDILINNAGITVGGRPLAETDEADWARVLDVNLNSAFYLCRAALPHLRPAGGRIVNVASNIVNSLPPGSAAYAASKAGLVALTQVLSKEEAAHGVRVNAVSPGMIAAGMGLGAMERRPPAVAAQFVRTIPMGRPGTAEEVAAAVLFLVGEESGYVTGQNLTVNGGDRCESYQ
ncbi:MAG: SDR family NAD(P)-dependent oxidoreductase [Gemmatimonadota bacterium]